MIKSLLVYGTVGTVLAYLTCHMHYGCQMVSYLLVDPRLAVIYLFACSWQLVVAAYYCCHCLSDNQQWLSIKVEDAGGLSLGRSTGRMGNSFRHSMYVYILYLRCKDVILAILCMGVPNSLQLMLMVNG